MTETNSSAGASARNESTTPSPTSTSEANHPAPKNMMSVVTSPMPTSSACALRNTRRAPAWSPMATRSATMREMAVGMPAELTTSSQE